MKQLPGNGIDAELDFHVERLIEMLVAGGVPRAEAVRRARQRFGDPARYRAEVLGLDSATSIGANRNWRTMFATVRQDIGYAVRTLLKAPGFSAIVIITLALGIGANTAIFSVINGVLVRSLGFPAADRLVAVVEQNPATGVTSYPTSAGTLLDWRDGTNSLAEIGAFTWNSITLEDPVESVVLRGAYVTGNYFATLRVEPLLGRLIHPDDAVPGQPGSVVVISYEMWNERWGADPAVVGRSITVDGAPATIVGVMRPGLPAPSPAVDVWQAIGFTTEGLTNRGIRIWHAVARLAPGASVEEAAAEIRTITDRIAERYPQSARGWTGTVIPLRDQLVGDVRASLIAAFVAVGVLLLIACVNVANLLLARATGREREVAVRIALGAGRGRLIQQLLTESVVLAGAGGLAGVGVAFAAHRTLLALEPGIIPRVEQIELSGAVLAFALLLSIATGFIFGVAPAVHGAGVQLTNTLKDGGQRGTTAGRGLHRVRGVLVTAQLALTVMLLCGAGLLLRTLDELRSIDPGFAAERAVAARVFLSDRSYPNDDGQIRYFSSVLDGIRGLPGVVAAGTTSALPMDPIGVNFDLPFRTEANAGAPGGEAPQADFRIVSAGYVEAVGIPVIAGRTFSTQDRADTPPVAMINQLMAEQYWPGQDPVGRRLQTVFGGWRWYEIVGVVGNTRFYGLDAEARPEMYVAHAQVPFSAMTIVARASGPTEPLMGALRRVMLDHDPNQPPHSVLPVSSLIADSIAAERFYAVLLAVFAGVALALATTGIYGVLSYWVGQRRREIGVRIALGAGRGAVFRLVVGSGMLLTVVGVGVGLIGAAAANRLIESMLFGVSSTDLATYAGVTAILIAAALVACWAPALRAARMDPISALRDE